MEEDYCVSLLIKREVDISSKAREKPGKESYKKRVKASRLELKH